MSADKTAAKNNAKTKYAVDLLIENLFFSLRKMQISKIAAAILLKYKMFSAVNTSPIVPIYGAGAEPKYQY